MMRFRTFLTLAAVSAAAACGDPAGPPDLAVTVAPTASNFKAGERIGVTVTVVNIGDEPTPIVVNGCPRPFEVIDQNGDRHPYDELCLGYLKVYTIEPGGSYSFATEWSGDENTGADRPATPTLVATGAYTLRGVVKVHNGPEIRSGIANVYVTR
jgi:hypothetical protein